MSHWKKLKKNYCQKFSSSIKKKNKSIYTNISITFTKHCAYKISGTNGAGKSSLINALLYKINKQKGKIILKQNIHLLNELKPWTHFYISVLEITLFWLTLKIIPTKINYRQIFHTLQLVDLQDQLYNSTKFLSQGQKTLLHLIKFIKIPKQIWILDEPNTYLDINNTKKLEKYIHLHIKTGGFIIITTHQKIEVPKKHSINL